MEDLPIGAEVVLKVVETKEADCTGCFFDEIAKHNWGFDCAAVKYYYSHIFDTGCKGNYTAIYAWR